MNLIARFLHFALDAADEYVATKRHERTMREAAEAELEKRLRALGEATKRLDALADKMIGKE